MRDDYGDIINMKYPFDREDKKHPPMPVEKRAKIFGSFAALRGHDESIEDRRELVEDMVNNHEIEHEVFYEDI